jgi:hypothetical protein
MKGIVIKVCLVGESTKMEQFYFSFFNVVILLCVW